MNSRSILVLVRRGCNSYDRYCEYIKPYLEVFGVPYEEIDEDCLCDRLDDGAALILFAQVDLRLSANASKKIVQAVEDGCGLFAASSSIIKNAEFEKFVEFIEFPMQTEGIELVVNNEHYITRFHRKNERIKLYSRLWFFQRSRLKDSEVLVSLGETPLLEIASFGKGKVVLMNTSDWISTDILGPVHGMDDIIREAIVWAAKKPFVMKGMPPFVAMRVDDVWGSWTDNETGNPLHWIDISNKYKLKPWLGVFTEDTNGKTAEIIKNYVLSGEATAFPHAFRGTDCTGPEPEDWIWYDHRHQRPWSEDVMQQRAAKAKEWFDEHSISISKIALPHYYEISECALPILLDWGCEFIGIATPTDAFYYSYEKIKCGPYRKFNARAASDKRPIYYADYLSCPNTPEVDKKLFNCMVEIRDVSGYELAPSNDVEKTIREGVEQLRRAILSGIPATVFTHETNYIRHITPENWEAEMKGITEGIEDLSPVYDTLDNIYRYVRASFNIKIENPKIGEDGKLEFSIKGFNDMDTKCYVFIEEGEDINVEERTIYKQVEYPR